MRLAAPIQTLQPKVDLAQPGTLYGLVVVASVNFVLVSLPLLFLPGLEGGNQPHLVLFLGSSLCLCAFEVASNARRCEVLQTFGAYQRAALFGAVLLLLMQWGCLIELHVRGSQNWLVAWVGFVIAMMGLAIRIAGIRNLGTAFCSDLRHARLVTSGIHSVMRHPSETGLLVASIGLVTMTGSWLTALVFLPLCTIAAGRRILVEEASLSQQHFTEYAEYRKTTSRLLPFGKVRFRQSR